MNAPPTPLIELLYWDGCPSHPQALAALRQGLEDLGLGAVAIVVREVGDDAQARAEGFVGSPTIRVAGRDLFPVADEPVGLTCRIYRRRNGQMSPTPDPDDLRDALRAALEDAP